MSTVTTSGNLEQSSSKTSSPENLGVPTAQLTHYQMLTKVRAKMNDLYAAIDAFKGALIEDVSDLVNQQLAAFSKLIPEQKEQDEQEEKVEASSVQVEKIEE